jgi:cyclic di-GMP phosphodiesterase Gmr
MFLNAEDDIHDLESASWLWTHFGTGSPRWRLPPDAGALRLWGRDDGQSIEMAVTAEQADAIRRLTGSLGTLPVQAQIEGRELKLRLIGRRTDRNEWMGVATSVSDTDAILLEIERGLSFTEQVLSEVNALIVIIDAQGNVRRFNRECERLSGKSEGEVLGRNALELFFPAEDARQIGENLATFFPTKKCWDTERDILTKAGRRRISWRNRLMQSPTLGDWFLVCSGTDVTEQRIAQAGLEKLATIDTVTDLPNRRSVEELIRTATSQSASPRFDLLFLDLDHFKNVNDHYGHATGDLLLRQVADLLSKCVQPADVVAHFGGDSFLLVLHNTTDARTDAVCRCIRHRMESSFMLGQIEVYSGCSIGVASFPGHGETVDQLVRNAETAMYAAKDAADAQCCRFTPVMTGQRKEIMWLHTNLRRALAENQFELHYQPKICLTTGRLVGVEALMRWNSPERGMVPPLSFIPYAEESGFILPLGRWLLREAVAQSRRWNDAGIDLRIAVNVSAPQLADPGLISDFVATMQAEGFTRSPLDIEITESCFAKDAQRTAGMLGELRGLGAEVSLDDFGTGYSSLSQLVRLPLDIIKIDQSFVRPIPHEARLMALLRSMVAVSHELGFRTVAEGVETEEQAAYLRKLGVNYAQGYLFGRPMPTAALESWLRARPLVV